MPTESPSPAARKTSVAMLVIMALLVVAPMIALSASPLRVNGSLWYLGMLPALMGLFTHRRLALAASILTPLLMGIALMLREDPILGAVFMAAIGIATGLSAMRGWHVMGAFAGPLVAYALIGNLQVTLPAGTVVADASVTSGLAAMACIAAGGLWTTLMGAFVIRASGVKTPRSVPRHTALHFAAALGILIGIAAYVCMQWLDPASWWIILTFFVVVQPYYSDSARRMLERVGGTFAGALIAVIVVAILHGAPAVITALAFVLTIGAAYAYLKLPYWAFAMLLTPAVVLQTSGSTHDLLFSIGERALYTLIGAAAAITVMSVGHMYLGMRAKQSAASNIH
ncbi:FUSC family protein [Microbacterium sp. A196]|uniref:FUSC family protein n=1 Tax=unclassified Microbacterium TaxID=2609290 RepID=UPI003FD0B04C